MPQRIHYPLEKRLHLLANASDLMLAGTMHVYNTTLTERRSNRHNQAPRVTLVARDPLRYQQDRRAA